MSLENLSAQFTAHNAAVVERLAEIQDQVNKLEIEYVRPKNGEAVKDTKLAACMALAQFARSGDEREFQNAMTVGDNTLGGYTESPALSDQINVKRHDASPMLGLCRVVQMGAGSSWQEPVDVSDADANWVAETESRDETSFGSFGMVDIPLNEMDALVKITQVLKDDSRFDLGGYIIDKIGGRFGRLEDAAFVSGDGIKKPKGFLDYATATGVDGSRAAQTYQYVPSLAATTLTADAIVNLSYSLRAGYRQNSSFVMSSDTARQVRLLKDGLGAFIWAPGLAAGSPDQLCGRPIVYDENMPSVAAGSVPIAIGDWKRAYTIVERPGIKWLQDPYSAKPYVLFYATRRVGGQSSGDFDALKLMRVGTA